MVAYKGRLSELYIGDNKLKYSRNPKEILKCAKNVYETLYIKETTSKAATTEFLAKISDRRKIFNEQFIFCEGKIYLGKIIKSINYQTNESPSNNGFPAEIYKHTSIKLASVLLDA